MAPRQNTPKSKKDKFIKSKIICQRLLTCKCALGLGTVTTDKKKKHTKVMIPVHHNNTKIHGPMGEIKENYRLTCWWWGSNFLHEIKKKAVHSSDHHHLSKIWNIFQQIWKCVSSSAFFWSSTQTYHILRFTMTLRTLVS